MNLREFGNIYVVLFKMENERHILSRNCWVKFRWWNYRKRETCLQM